jgi:hypothetical protein
MNLQDLEILEDDFDLFVALNDRQKVEFLFDALETGIEASILKQIAKLDSLQPSVPTKQKVSTEDLQFGPHRLCITAWEKEVHLNSDSLIAIRKFVNKMINDGLMLWPTDTKKSNFDLYRFFKAYKIIGRFSPISSN